MTANVDNGLNLKSAGTYNIYDARREKVHFVSRESQCFPRLPQSSDDLLYSWKFWSWKFIKPRCNGTRRSTFAGNSALLPSNVIEFCNVTGWEILAGNSFIGTCHVTLKRPMRAQAVGKRIGQLHDDVIWLQLPESLSLLFSYAN